MLALSALDNELSELELEDDCRIEDLDTRLAWCCHQFSHLRDRLDLTPVGFEVGMAEKAESVDSGYHL